MSDELNAARARYHHAAGATSFHLEMFGDYLAKREGYRSHTGIDAVHFYLVNKHGWLPRDVRSMSEQDLRWCLEEEMRGWTIPDGAKGLYPG